MFNNQYLFGQPMAQALFVSNEQEARALPVQFNTVTLAINKQSNEVYMKSINNNGELQFAKYINVQPEMSDGDKIIFLENRVKTLEEKLNEYSNYKLNATSNGRTTSEQSYDATVQSTNAGQEQATTNANFAQPCQV